MIRVGDPGELGLQCYCGVGFRSKARGQSGQAQFTYSNPNQTSITDCSASVSRDRALTMEEGQWE